MSSARYLTLLFTSIFLLITIFWFSSPCHSSSSVLHGLEKLLPWLVEDERSENNIKSFTNAESQYLDKDFYRFESHYDARDRQNFEDFPPSAYNILSRTHGGFQYYSGEDDHAASDESRTFQDEMESRQEKSEESALEISNSPKQDLRSHQMVPVTESKTSYYGSAPLYLDQANSIEHLKNVVGIDGTEAGTSDENEGAPEEKEENFTMIVNEDSESSKVFADRDRVNVVVYYSSKISQLDQIAKSLDGMSEQDPVGIEVVNKIEAGSSETMEGIGRVSETTLPMIVNIQHVERPEVMPDDLVIRNKDFNRTENINVPREKYDQQSEVPDQIEIIEIPENKSDERSEDAEYIKIIGIPKEKPDQQFEEDGQIEIIDNEEEKFDQQSEEAETKASGSETEMRMPVKAIVEYGIVLSKKNFSKFVTENKYVAVHFYMSYTFYVQDSEFAAAATMLKDKVVFAKVDASVEKELAREHGFVGVSTLYFFIDGIPLHTYRRFRRREALVSSLKEKMEGGIYSVTKLSQAHDILETDSIILLALLENLQGPDSEELAAAVPMLEEDIRFSHTTNRFIPTKILYQTDSRYIPRLFGIDPNVRRPALFMRRKDSREFFQFDGAFTSEAIADFLSKNEFPLVTAFSSQNALSILKNPLSQLWLFAAAHEVEKVMPTFKQAAEAFNGKLLFVHFQMDHNNIAKRLSYEFSGTGNDTTVVSYSGTEASLKCAMKGQLSLTNIKTFGEEVMEDKQCKEAAAYNGGVLFDGLLEW